MSAWTPRVAKFRIVDMMQLEVKEERRRRKILEGQMANMLKVYDKKIENMNKKIAVDTALCMLS